MKTLILLTVLGLSLSAMAQERTYGDHEKNARQQYNDNRDYHAKSNVPQRVYNSFRRDHPDVDNVQWERSGRSWHAQYQDARYNGRRVDAYYNERGRNVDTHIPIDVRQLPVGFDDHIYNEYHTHDYRVYRIDRRGGSPVFRVVLNGINGMHTVYTNEYGNPVRYRDTHRTR